MKTLRHFLFITTLLIAAVACKKEFDTPPVRTLPTGQVLTVSELRALEIPGTPKRFGGDSSVYAVVTADEESGNLYKNVYVQDHTGAIVIRLVNTGGLYQGDSIRIYLPGTVLSRYQGMLQLDSVDVDNNVVKQATNIHKEPETVTLTQITPEMQGKLVRVEGVEFAKEDACVGLSYSDPINQSTVNRDLLDCDGQSVLVRTSGYANFAGQPLALGNGSLVAVVGQFQDDMQLFIRDINEVNMTGERCDPCPEMCPADQGVMEDFSSAVANVDLEIECWHNRIQTGTRVWRGYSVSGNMATQATSFQSGGADIAWLISPLVQYSPGLTLSFRAQRGFGVAGHQALEVLIATDYDATNLSTANWTTVPATLPTPSTPDQLWVESGTVDLASVLPGGFNGTFVVGFKYSGNGGNGQTTNIRIDDVMIQ